MPGVVNGHRSHRSFLEGAFVLAATGQRGVGRIGSEVALAVIARVGDALQHGIQVGACAVEGDPRGLRVHIPVGFSFALHVGDFLDGLFAHGAVAIHTDGGAMRVLDLRAATAEEQQRW